ncbi:hypothetical protein JVU11DRAFT_5587 [Chiua virens]|nr:hypothetical protein JVU11DRAFT_5587 [Chiua virens]
MSPHASRSKTPPLDDDIDSESSDEDIVTPRNRPMLQTASSINKTVSPDSVMMYNTDSTQLSRPMHDRIPRLMVQIQSASTTVVGPNAPVENLTGTSTGGNHDSISSVVECRWIQKMEVCDFTLTKQDLKRHLADCHGIKAMSHNIIVQCRWEGCGKSMKRESLLRHIYEKHLGYRRDRERKTQASGLGLQMHTT